MITTHTYRESRSFWLSAARRFRDWCSYSDDFRQKIIDTSRGNGAPTASDKDCQRSMAVLRRKFFAVANARARRADTHKMIGRAHIAYSPSKVTLTWQWFDAAGARRTKAVTVPDDGDWRSLGEIELAERPGRNLRWASRDWVEVA